MKRLHIHIHVEDLAAATRFYSAMFGSQPTVEKPDYAKWLLDDPSVNLAISQRNGYKPGIDHLGVQAETAEEFEQLHSRLSDARYSMLEQQAAACCYAKSDKQWVVDTAGVTWEIFHTLGEAKTYGEDHANTAVLTALSRKPQGESCGCS